MERLLSAANHCLHIKDNLGNASAIPITNVHIVHFVDKVRKHEINKQDVCEQKKAGKIATKLISFYLMGIFIFFSDFLLHI